MTLKAPPFIKGTVVIGKTPIIHSIKGVPTSITVGLPIEYIWFDEEDQRFYVNLLRIKGAFDADELKCV